MVCILKMDPRLKWRLTADDLHEMGHIFLVHEVQRAGPPRLIAILGFGELGHHDDACLRIQKANRLGRLDAAHARHAHVHDDPVRMIGSRNLHRLLARTGFQNRHIQSLEHLSHRLAQSGVVIHDE